MSNEAKSNSKEQAGQAMAALGLVSKSGSVYHVEQKGFGKAPFVVSRTESGQVVCSCNDNQEVCSHRWAVRYAVAMGKVSQSVSKPAAAVKSHEAQTMADLVTPKQLVCMRIVANSQGLNIYAECEHLFGCNPERLNRKAASQMIDYLKNARSMERRVA